MTKPIPLPAHVHYEVLLQLLERQTFPVVQEQDFASRARTQELITTLRKALSLQEQLEAEWQQRGFHVDYRWSLER